MGYLKIVALPMMQIKQGLAKYRQVVDTVVTISWFTGASNVVRCILYLIHPTYRCFLQRRNQFADHTWRTAPNSYNGFWWINSPLIFYCGAYPDCACCKLQLLLKYFLEASIFISALLLLSTFVAAVFILVVLYCKCYDHKEIYRCNS